MAGISCVKPWLATRAESLAPRNLPPPTSSPASGAHPPDQAMIVKYM